MAGEAVSVDQHEIDVGGAGGDAVLQDEQGLVTIAAMARLWIVSRESGCAVTPRSARALSTSAAIVGWVARVEGVRLPSDGGDVDLTIKARRRAAGLPVSKPALSARR